MPATVPACVGIPVPLGAGALGHAVHALRCGLDATHWQEPGCQRLLGPPPAHSALPFDLKRAHNLFEALLGGVDDLIRDRHLLIVMAGPLTKLPLHVLVTELPNPTWQPDERYRLAAWLGRRQPISVLPSVASLHALRMLAQSSAAPNPMIGFGNPLLTGSDGTDRSAWSKRSCADTLPIGQRPAGLLIAAAPIAGSLFRGGHSNLALVRQQAPLPETADELCAVARSVGAPETAIRLGAQATEAAIKDLSRSGELASHSIVHFATHGLVAGDLPNLAEPALMLTPPERASEEDDGLLTASEITQLKLNADWVIMSACNTAAGGAANADALSGLARAFFYAGARSLLVSHWAVNSEATVKLITKAVSVLKADPSIGRAEAMRRSMLAMIEQGTPEEAHPALWAPFILVGEGAATPATSIMTSAIPAGVELPAQTRPTAIQKPAPTVKRSKRPRTTTVKPVPEDWRANAFRN